MLRKVNYIAIYVMFCSLGMLLEDCLQKIALASFQKLVCKGELIEKNKYNQWIVAYSEPLITVDCQEDQVKIVEPLFVLFLLAVNDLDSRYNLFINELKSLEKNVSLNLGDKVDVQMEQQAIPTAGKVKYRGNLPGKNGIFFGIEILVSQSLHNLH